MHALFRVEIQKGQGAPIDVECEQASAVLGKDKDALFELKGWRIGRRQIQISVQESGIWVHDGGGLAPMSVNGQNINEYGPLSSKDLIELTEYRIRVHPIVGAPQPSAEPATNNANARENDSAAALIHKEPAPALRSVTPSTSAASIAPSQPDAPPSVVESSNISLDLELRKRLHRGLIAAMDLRRVNVSRMDDDELKETVGQLIEDIVNNDVDFSQMPLAERQSLSDIVLHEVVGLGPLEELLADDSVSEIMVNRHDQIFIEKSGRLQRSSVAFSNEASVISAIERIVSPLGRRIDEASPMVDARLKDGSRVNAVIPPLAIRGPSITIRKFSKRKLGGQDLVNFGSANAAMLEFMQIAVQRRANVVISGGTGSGKTTLLNILSSFIPDDERIVTVEDAAELQLLQPNLVSLEARPPNVEGRGAITIRDLVRNCLRMRPDRIVVGECRGGEALDMLQAMNTGHDGSLTTTHANAPRDCLSRLEVMTLMSGLDLPVQAIREQVCAAVDIIVQQTRFSCGSRRITYITEVVGIERDVIQLQDIFVFKQDGYGPDGRIQGRFEATGHVPDFYQDLIKRGISLDTSIFQTPG